jgi:hypothetical protein
MREACNSLHQVRDPRSAARTGCARLSSARPVFRRAMRGAAVDVGRPAPDARVEQSDRQPGTGNADSPAHALDESPITPLQITLARLTRPRMSACSVGLEQFGTSCVYTRPPRDKVRFVHLDCADEPAFPLANLCDALPQQTQITVHGVAVQTGQLRGLHGVQTEVEATKQLPELCLRSPRTLSVPVLPALNRR